MALLKNRVIASSLSAPAASQHRCLLLPGLIPSRLSYSSTYLCRSYPRRLHTWCWKYHWWISLLPPFILTLLNRGSRRIISGKFSTKTSSRRLTCKLLNAFRLAYLQCTPLTSRARRMRPTNVRAAEAMRRKLLHSQFLIMHSSGISKRFDRVFDQKSCCKINFPSANQHPHTSTLKDICN